MKTYALLCVILACMLVITPALSLSNNGDINGEDLKQKAVETVKSVLFDDDKTEETVEVMRTISGNSEKVSMKDYLCGAVAGEMPVVYNIEALKAQTVACYTYVKSKELSGEMITDNPNKNQSYLSKAELKEKWGDSFDKYYRKLEKAVDSVMGEYLEYDGQPLSTVAFHAISPGKTVSASRVWGGTEIPYLTSVDSSADKCAPDYSKTIAISGKTLLDALKSSGIEFESSVQLNPQKLISNIAIADDGRVESLCVGGRKISGSEFREMLGLRSQYFTVSTTGTNFESAKFLITTLGYGHGVGMSQYGASAMADAGSDYKEILAHYYPGTILQMH